jgi:hypothetical protein
MALVSIQLRIHWVLRLRISGVIPPIFHMASWHIQEQIYLYTEHHCGVFIRNIPGQNTDPAPHTLVTIL